jgi:hypothetical protein
VITRFRPALTLIVLVALAGWLTAEARRPIVLQVDQQVVLEILGSSPPVAEILWMMTGRAEVPAGLVPNRGDAFSSGQITANHVKRSISGAPVTAAPLPGQPMRVSWTFDDAEGAPQLTFEVAEQHHANQTFEVVQTVVVVLEQVHGLVYRVANWKSQRGPLSEYQRARAVAMRYSRALTTGDVQAVSSMLHPEFVAGMGGPAETQRLFSEVFPKHDAGGSAWYQEEIAQGEAHVDDEVRLYFFPVSRRIVGADPGLRPMHDTYLVHSADGGRSWTVVSNWCGISEERIRSRLAPNYQGSPPLRSAVAR